MFSFLPTVTTFELSALTAFATFIAGVVFSQKVKDWFSGVPSDVRSALKTVEASALGNLKDARNTVLSQIVTALPHVASAASEDKVAPKPAQVQVPPAPLVSAPAPAPFQIGTLVAGAANPPPAEVAK